MNKKVLVIDDEEINLILFKIYLEKFNITITTAESGMEGINYHKENKFDLIVTDFNMPGLNGLQTLQILREHDDSKNVFTPILLYTANTLRSKQEWKMFGFNDVMFKPIQKELIIACINQHLFPEE